jgi:hypothetical protein
VYERSGYTYFIDYGTAVKPTLNDHDQAWVESYLQQQGLI